MPSLESVLKFREEMYRESVDLIARKGHDYNRQQQHDGDTLFNLRVAEVLGIVPTAERGILVRLSDKFMRLISLMSADVDPAVKGESVRDTVRDIHNYADYALMIFEERRAVKKAAIDAIRLLPAQPVPAQPPAPETVPVYRDETTRAANEPAAYQIPESDRLGARRDSSLR